MSHETIRRVIECLARVTRYPEKLLTPDADLENDLGIDSVKLVEIVLALSEEFELDLHAEERDPSIRTIGDVAGWVQGFLGQNDNTPAREECGSCGDVPAKESGPVRISDAPMPVVPTPHYNTRAPLSNETRPAAPFAGRVALVTGSGRGVGKTIARTLAARGATVVVNSFHSRDQGDRTAEEIVAAGGSAIHCWGSVANRDHVDQIFAEIEQRYGRLDMLICNASDGKLGAFSDLSPDDWDRAFRTNVSGHYHCAMRAAEIMRPRGGGAIVTMSAVGAHAFINGLGSQGVVKAAVEALTRYLACELGRSGIRVNCVVGGPVYGDLLSKFPETQARQQHWESMTPDGELTDPVDLAETIAFLVSDQARGINGAVWSVDHGFSANADGQPLNHGLGRMGLQPAQRPQHELVTSH